jgi:hypothetical protein
MAPGLLRFARNDERAHVAPGSAPAYLPSVTDREPIVTIFDDRERAFEPKFAPDEEMRFRIMARRNKLLGHWAANLMHLSPVEAEAYARDVVRADFEEAGDEDVIRKLLGDITGANIEIDEADIRQALAEQTIEARRQLLEARG